MQNLQQSINLVLDYVKGIWIKKRYVMFCSWLICPIGFFYVASMPDQYQSRAVVFVDTRSVLQPILRGLAIQTNPAQEIQMMVKTLLSRSNVEKIARESDLDLYTQDEDEFDQLVSRLTKDIRMGGTGRDNIYTISYSNAKPLVAQRVVQETLDLFVEGALGGNRRENDTAGRFLDEQIADYERRLAEAESELADFKRRYSNVLPLQGTFYSRLQSLNEELRTTKLQIRQLTQQAETLQGKLVKAKSLDGFGVNNGNDSVLQTRYDERIRSLEEELDRLRLRFTDQHPDVIET
ncbi:MAG TPA: chain-length determining protein, partial [Alteromonas sp.]|nr:chain-length determining protein [Alteromonas sp.]